MIGFAETSLNLTLLLIVILVAPVLTAEECQENELFCRGRCVSIKKVCDGLHDCKDSSDELNCTGAVPELCAPDEFNCPNTSSCISFALKCDGVSNCPGDFDERSCSSSPLEQKCSSAHFECFEDAACVPIAFRCDRTGQCIDGSDEKGCVPPSTKVPPVREISAFAGESVTLSCAAHGSPLPFITWLKDLKPLQSSPRFTVKWERGGNGTLTIHPVRVLDAGEYSCHVSSSLGTFVVQPSTILVVNDSNPFICQDRVGNTYVEGSFYYDRLIDTSGEAREFAADVVFVVDESGSMTKEHDWITDAVAQLDSSLHDQGVGIGNRPNLFALIGFAVPDEDKIAGHILTDLASPAEFKVAATMLSLDGSYEDGFSAINYALHHVSLRNNTTRIMILVTDEDRRVLNPSLSSMYIQQQLKNAGFILNVIVNQGFLAGSALALGLNWNGTAFLYDDTKTNLYTTGSGARHPLSLYNYLNVYENYVELAFEMKGAAWDLNQLRFGGNYLLAFTNSFVDEKVIEVTNVYRLCFKCFCHPPNSTCLIEDFNFLACTGPTLETSVLVNPITATVQIGQTISFECAVTPKNASIMEYGLFWSYPNEAVVAIMGSILTVRNVTEQSKGQYSCSVHNRSSSGFLDVTVPPSITALEHNVTLQLNALSGVQLWCSFSGIPVPYIHFQKLSGEIFNSSSVIVFKNNTAALTIPHFLLSDVGVYICVANSIAGEAKDFFNVTISQCAVDNTTLFVGENRFILKTYQTADIVLIIDESASMSMQHGWIPNMVLSLDNALKQLGIGNNPQNRFGIVGFGGDCLSIESSLGNVFSDNASQLFYSSKDISSVVELLEAHGQSEDGYSAIEAALKNFVFRNGARQFILISDEDRDVLKSNLTQSYIQKSLHEAGIILNAVVSQRMYAGELRAIGADVNRTAYLFDPTSSSLSMMLEGSMVSTPAEAAYGHTFEDYSQLAWNSKGAVWDLSLLQSGGLLTEAFISAFISANVEGIVAQTETCFKCTCLVQGASCIEVSSSFCHPNSSGHQPPLQESLYTFTFSDNVLLRNLYPIVGVLDINQSGTVTCSSPTPASLGWTFEGGVLPSNTRVEILNASASQLIIFVMTSENAGAYACVGRSINGLSRGVGIVHLEINDSLKLGLHLIPKELVTRKGCDITIQCLTSEPSIFLWLFNDGPLVGNVHISNGPISSMLSTLVAVAGDHNQGLYTCMATSTNGGTSSSSTAFVNVVSPPLLLKVEPSQLYVIKNESAVFSCTVTGFCSGVNLTIEWLRKGQNISSKVVSQKEENMAIMRLEHVSRQDDGVYYCRAQLYDSIVESSVELRVNEAISPAIMVRLSSLEDMPIPAGTNAHFLCETNQDAGTIGWVFEGQLVQVTDTGIFSHFVLETTSNTSSLLSIYDSTLSHTGVLMCHSNGVSSSPIQISFGMP